MARRAVIRSRAINTSIAQLEEMIKADYRKIWSKHKEDLEGIVEEVYSEAKALVPVDTGKLRDSIKVWFSKSRRYPYIIAHAQAYNGRGFDYALIQEETEEPTYYHDNDKMAHYLGGPFAREVSYWYEEITGKEMELPDELQQAIDYIEERGA